MKVRLFLMLFIGISLSLGCSRHRPYPLFMEQAQCCMETAPDSALHYLSLLEDSIRREPEETQRYYHLLTIKAKDKLYIRHTSDSLIHLIVKFYNGYGDKNKLMEAYYYQGSVYRDMNDAPSALDAFNEVIRLSRELPPADREQSAGLMARTYNQMGTLFAYQGLYDESLQANRESANCYLAQGKEDKTSYALRDIARMYDAGHQNDSALHYYQKAYRTALSARSPHKAYVILGELGCFYYYNLAKADSAKQMLVTALNHQPNMANVLLVLGDVYRGEARWDSACYYLHQAIEYGDIHKRHSAYRHLSSIEIQKHNYPQAITYLRQAQLLADSIKEITRTEAVAKINSLYNYQHTQKENYKLQQENTKQTTAIYALGGAILVIIGGSVYYYTWKKEKTKKQIGRLNRLKEDMEARSEAAIKSNSQKIKELESQLEEARKQTDSMRQEIIQARKASLEVSNRQIVATMHEQTLLREALCQTPIYLFFHRACNETDGKVTEKDWSELQTAIDTAYPDFIKRLYDLLPKLSLTELRICCLVKISISPKNIAFLTHHSKSAISNARARLAKKMLGAQGTAEELDSFISDLQ